MHRSLFVFLLLFLLSCNRYQPVTAEYVHYRVKGTHPDSASLPAFLVPYADSVNRSMNKIIGEVGEKLVHTRPEGSLGNFLADALLEMSTRNFGKQVDVAMLNYGGIRLYELTPGKITIGTIYELMPFDNLAYVQNLKGSVLKQLLDYAASKGGWPVAGLTMTIDNRMAKNIRIAGKPIDTSAWYRVVNSDFIVKGGDNVEILRSIPFESNGYLVRDAFIDYISLLNSQGRVVMAPAPGRVKNVQ